jgi:8-oxo-dGTP pyrophosphatase MutT (NUDIX family)
VSKDLIEHDDRLPKFSEAAFILVDDKNATWDQVISSSRGVKSAAVLFLFFWDTEQEKLKVVLTIRSTKLPTHKGQISFAGGHKDPSDSTPEETALREAQEELGIDSSRVKTIGRMHSVTGIDGKTIVPVVGILDGVEKNFVINEEIEKLILCDANLLSKEKNEPFDFVLFGKTRRSNLFRPEGHKVWGLTAGIIESAGLTF